MLVLIGRGGNGALVPEAIALLDDHGMAELGPEMGDAAGGLADRLETPKGRADCGGSPERGPCAPLTVVLMVGLGRSAPAVLADRVAMDTPFA